MHEASVPRRLLDKWWIVVQVFPAVALLVAAKVAVVELDGDFIDSASLIETVIAGNVFVLGFLLAGTLADYKEGERLPGELASSIESISDEFEMSVTETGAQDSRDALGYMARLATVVREWFYGSVATEQVLSVVTGLNTHLLALEPRSQPQYVTRLKQEQANIRRMLIRIETIRETQFVAAGYAMAEVGTVLVLAGFLFVNVGPAFESGFFMGLVAFLLIYLVLLIRDLDNPFDHYTESRETARVSLHPIIEVERRLRDRAAAAGSEAAGPRSDAEAIDLARSLSSSAASE